MSVPAALHRPSRLRRARTLVLARVLGLVACLGLLGSPQRAAANQLRSETGMEIRLADAVRLGLAGQVRIDLAPVALDRLLWEVGVDLRPWRWLRIGAGYRFGLRKLTAEGPLPQHRLSADVELVARLRGLRLGLRQRYQGNLPVDIEPGSHDLRTRFALSFRDGDLPVVPSASVELFLALVRPVFLERWRMTIGLGIPLQMRGTPDWNDGVEVELAYKLEQDTSGLNPPEHIFEIAWTFALDLRPRHQDPAPPASDPAD